MAPKNKKVFFTKIFSENADSITRMCYMYLKDKDLAQDAAQETFMKAYSRLSSYKEKSSVNTWLSAIAINTCKNIMRTKAFKCKVVSIEDMSVADTYTMQENESDISVSEAVSSLPEALRSVILLRYYQDLKIEDIAKILKLPQTTINYRLLKAKSLLREKLKEDIDYE